MVGTRENVFKLGKLKPSFTPLTNTPPFQSSLSSSLSPSLPSSSSSSSSPATTPFAVVVIVLDRQNIFQSPHSYPQPFWIDVLPSRRVSAEKGRLSRGYPEIETETLRYAGSSLGGEIPA